jgi:hypothetical protein
MPTDDWLVAADADFLIESDASARDWLDSRHDDGPRIISQSGMNSHLSAI